MSGIAKYNEKYILFIKAGVFALIPVLAVIMYAAIQGEGIGRVYIPNSQWNDEFGYFSMIGSMIKYGEPLGYCGYNESHAQISTYGAWSPVMYIPYALLGKVFGWTYMSPIYFNVLFVFASLVFLYVELNPDAKTAIYILIISCLFIPLARWTLSCTPETLFAAMLICFFSVWIKVNKSRETGINKKDIVFLNMLSIMLSLMRPTYLILFLLICILLYDGCCGKWFALCGLELSIALFTALIYFRITALFCCPYFFPQIDLEWLKLFKLTFRGGIKNAITILTEGITTIGSMCFAMFSEGRFEGSIYVMSIIITLMSILICVIYRRVFKEMVMIIGSNLLLCMANVFLYNPILGSRHLIQWIFVECIVVGFVIADVTGNEKGLENLIRVILAFSVILCFTYNIKRDVYEYNVPAYDAVFDAEIEKGQEILREYISADNPRWDNTVIIPWDCLERDLYCLPLGAGVSTCSDEFVVANKDNLKSKYIMLYKDGWLIDELGLRGEEPVASFDETYVYALRD